MYFIGNPSHVNIVFQNALNWWIWNIKYVSKCMDSDSSFADGLPSPEAHFLIFCLSQLFSTFSRVHTAFEQGKWLKNSCIFIFSSPDAIFKTSEVSVALFCNIMQNLMQASLSLCQQFSAYAILSYWTAHASTEQGIVQKSHVLHPRSMKVGDLVDYAIYTWW